MFSSEDERYMIGTLELQAGIFGHDAYSGLPSTRAPWLSSWIGKRSGKPILLWPLEFA